MISIILLIVIIPVFGFTSEQKIHGAPENNKEKYFKDQWFGIDKLKHFLASAMITGAGSHISCYQFHHNKKTSKSIGAVISFTLGIGKEILDKKSFENKFSYKDIVANLFGIITGILLLSSW